MPKDPKRDQKKAQRREQKRKKVLAEKKRKTQQAEGLTYMGSKYQTEELTTTWLHTETGIYEAYVISERKLLDQTVFAAVERLARQLRAGTLPPLSDERGIDYDPDDLERLVLDCIRLSWADRFGEGERPPRDKLVGVLRSILGSITKVRAAGPQSQSYLQHIAGFLTKRCGIRVQEYTGEGKPVPEPPEDPLVTLGREWYEDGDLDARAEFYELAQDLVKAGQSSRVISACHLLIGEMTEPISEITAELTAIILSAGNSLVAEMS